MLHHLVALLRFLIGGAGGQGSLLGVLRHFLHGCSHFMHSGGGLFGFHLLVLHTNAGLRGNRRQLLGGSSNLADATANAPNQGAQAHAHHLHGGHQLARLVTPILRQVVGQVASCDALGKHHGLL